MFFVHGASLHDHIPQVTIRNTTLTTRNVMQAKGYVILLASKGFAGPKGKWTDEELAERVSLEITNLDSFT